MNSDTFPNAIVYPAHPTNYYTPAGHGGIPNNPKGLVLHTPEEPADNNPYTPKFFADPNRQASTHYFAAFTGDLYQMVPENCMAIANGVLGKPYPAWADPATSLNWQTLNIEIEGYAANMSVTCPRGSKQWNLVVIWIAILCSKYHIPIDRDHIIGHYQVASNRTDPGTLDINNLVLDAKALGQPILEDDMAQGVHANWKDRPPTTPYRTYLLFGTATGMKKYFVRSPDEEKALRSAGIIGATPIGLSLKDLKQYVGTPEPDAP